MSLYNLQSVRRGRLSFLYHYIVIKSCVSFSSGLTSHGDLMAPQGLKHVDRMAPLGLKHVDHMARVGREQTEMEILMERGRD